MFYFNSTLKAYLEQTHPISTVKTVLHRKHSFQSLTKLSKGNNVPDAAASNIDGFLHRATGACST
jgi:hypothetical protein